MSEVKNGISVMALASLLFYIPTTLTVSSSSEPLMWYSIKFDSFQWGPSDNLPNRIHLCLQLWIHFEMCQQGAHFHDQWMPCPDPPSYHDTSPHALHSSKAASKMASSNHCSYDVGSNRSGLLFSVWMLMITIPHIFNSPGYTGRIVPGWQSFTENFSNQTWGTLQ